MRLLRSAIVAVLLAVVLPSRVKAGMPSVTLADIPRAAREVSRTGLTDLARQRLEVISFFLLAMLGCAWVVQRVWNSLRKDFPVLPRISFSRAFGGLVLWGLLFIIILTMISGARELMTPGAWEKHGLTYRLANTPPPASEDQISARYEAIERLRNWLITYAKRNGDYPPSDKPDVIPAELLQVPNIPSGRYVYRGGHYSNPDEDESRGDPTPLAFEPDAVGPDRLVVQVGGTILWLPESEIEATHKKERP